MLLLANGWRSVLGLFVGSFACVPHFFFSGFQFVISPLCLAGFLFIFLPTALWQFDARNWSFPFVWLRSVCIYHAPTEKKRNNVPRTCEGIHNFNYAGREINFWLIFVWSHWLCSFRESKGKTDEKYYPINIWGIINPNMDINWSKKVTILWLNSMKFMNGKTKVSRTLWSMSLFFKSCIFKRPEAAVSQSVSQ